MHGGLMVATPGGIVERPQCGTSGDDFEAGARATAIKELMEEAGLQLDPQVTPLSMLRVCPSAYWGQELHRNYYVKLRSKPALKGPHRRSAHEVEYHGMKGIGQPAGDSYHAWLTLSQLLSRTDLLEACRVPLLHLYDIETGAEFSYASAMDG